MQVNKHLISRFLSGKIMEDFREEQNIKKLEKGKRE